MSFEPFAEGEEEEDEVHKHLEGRDVSVDEFVETFLRDMTRRFF